MAERDGETSRFVIKENKIDKLVVQNTVIVTNTTHPVPDTPDRGEKSLATRRIFQTHEEEKIKEVLNWRIEHESRRELCGDGLRTPAEDKWPELRVCEIYSRKRNVKCSSSTEKADGFNVETFGLKAELHQLFSGTGFTRSSIRSEKDNGSFVALLGGPGSGKTTFVRRYGKMVLKKEIEEMLGITIVYFVNASELAMNMKRTTFFDLMFSKLVHDFHLIKEDAIEWLQDNQSKVLFLIDGINELQRMKLHKQRRSIEYDECAEPAVIMYNFLCGRLMPKSKVLAASRFHGILNYNENIRPFTFKLAGLTREDAMYLFKEMIGSGGDEKWERLSENLKSLCSTPLWLNYVAFMHLTDLDLKMAESKFKIDDASSILVHLLLNFYNREGWEENPERFVALKKFCLANLKQSKGIFTELELQQHHLAKEDIMNLCLTHPKGQQGVMEVSRSKSYIWFCHMLIQESLACLGFLDLDMNGFMDTLKQHLKAPHFKCVQELSCGILINSRTRAFAMDLIKGVKDINEKTRLLSESLHLNLNRSETMAPDEISSHLACLHEMGARVTSETPLINISEMMPHAVNLSLHVLTICSMHIFSPVIARCKELSELVLYGCSLDDAKLKILWESLKSSELVIHALNLALNCGIGYEGMREIAKTVCHCQVHELVLHSCDLSDKHAEMFLDQIRTSLPVNTKALKFKNLFLRSNSGLGLNGLKAVANVVEIVGLEKLDISRCKVNTKVLSNMMEFDLRSLKVLMLSGFEKEESRLTVVGDCIVQNDIEELHISKCKLEHRDLLDLEMSLLGLGEGHCCLKKLNVSNNKLNSSECHGTLNRIARTCGTEIMDVRDCKFSDEQMKILKDNTVK